MALHVQPEAECVQKLSEATGVAPEVLCFWLNDDFLKSADPTSKDVQAAVLTICPSAKAGKK